MQSCSREGRHFGSWVRCGQPDKLPSQVAQAMVTQYGFSERLGKLHVSQRDQNLLSDKEKELIDAETRALVQGAYERAKALLTKHRDKLDSLATALMDKETLTGEQIREVVGMGPPEGEGGDECVVMRSTSQ